MSGYPWLKLYNEMVDDPKFSAAATMAGTSRAVALTAFLKALTHANQHDDRGSINGLHPAVVAEVCGATSEVIRRLWQAFRELGMLIGERIANWVKRQVAEKPRTAGAERTAKWRRKKTADDRQLGLDLAAEPVTPSVTSGVTEGLAEQPYAFEKAGISPPLLESESDEESPPPNPPKGGPMVSALVEPRQVEILLPLNGGRRDGRRRETARQRRLREFKEIISTPGMASRLAGDRATSGAAGGNRAPYRSAR